MSYHILPFLLIVLSLVGIVIVVARRFPQLTLLDVDSIPEVKADKKKAEFLKKRVEQKGVEAQKKRREKWKPVVAELKQIQTSFRKYVGAVEHRIMQGRQERAETDPQKEERREELRTLMHEADLAREAGDFETAEKKCITAIRIDPKNAEPYRGLAQVYVAQGQIAEAKETYKFIHQMDPNDDAVLVRLGDLAESEGDIQGAIDYYQQAVLLNDHLPMRFVKMAEMMQQLGQYQTALAAIEQAIELEPQNPKYLDMLVEISIMVGDKTLAEKAFQEFRMVNPENQKLDILKERIQKMAV